MSTRPRPQIAPAALDGPARLDTGDQQPDALALFHSAGYGEIPDYNGNPYASFWFEKRL